MLAVINTANCILERGDTMEKYTEFSDKDRIETHFIIDELIRAGETPEIARAHVKATLDLIYGRVATVNDIRVLDKGIREELIAINSRLDKLEFKLGFLVWAIGGLIAAIASAIVFIIANAGMIARFMQAVEKLAI